MGSINENSWLKRSPRDNARPSFPHVGEHCAGDVVRQSLRNWIRAEQSEAAMPTILPPGEFPWGTKGALNRIGERLRAGEKLSLEDVRALELWRSAHFHVLNAFNAMLRQRTRGKHITVARRHKRRVTIIDKLAREPRMQLARMDDVAGIRLIFRNTSSLLEFRNNFLKSNHNHEKKNLPDKYDYIKRPKATGYRGIHDVYSYKSLTPGLMSCNGTMIEVQYRTAHQHAWSTANEVVTMITPNQRTKFAQADGNYMEFFRLASEILARAFDRRYSVYRELSNDELLSRFAEIERETWLLNRLRGLNVARPHIGRGGSIVLRFTPEQDLYIMPVPRFQDAMKFYFKAESDFPEDDVVLVNAPDTGGVRSAYRNYFSDTTEFLSFMDDADEILRRDGPDAEYGAVIAVR